MNFLCKKLLRVNSEFMYEHNGIFSSKKKRRVYIKTHEASFINE